MNETLEVAKQIPEGMTGLQMLFYYFIGPASTILLTWMATKLKAKSDKRKAELASKNTELDNIGKGLNILNMIIEKLEQQLEAREKEILELKQQLNAISIQNEKLLTKLEQLEKDYDQLQRSYKELKKELSK